jgi:hypothetical protein
LFCVCLKRVGWVLFGAAEYDGVVIGSGCWFWYSCIDLLSRMTFVDFTSSRFWSIGSVMIDRLDQSLSRLGRPVCCYRFDFLFRFHIFPILIYCLGDGHQRFESL